MAGIGVSGRNLHVGVIDGDSQLRLPSRSFVDAPN
jgi:hypothetical protein